MERVPRAVALVAGISVLVLGLWAFLAPASFYAHVATFPPYNRHLIHDIGAFLSGIGAALLFALVLADGMSVALWGASVGLVLHGVAHIEDRALGGRKADPVTLTLGGLIVLGAAVAHARRRV